MKVVKKSGWHTSPTTVRPFIFSLLQLTDDDLLLDTSASASLGEISIGIWRTILKPRVIPYKFSCRTLPGELQLHERSKKMTSHHVKLGEEKEITFSPVSNYTKTYPDKKPILTFVFKYRPLDILKANGIVPLTFGQKCPATTELEAEENTRKTVAEIQNASTHRIEASENRPATTEPEVGAIKQEEGSRKDVEVQSASANRIKTSEKRPATAEPERNDIKQEEGTNLKENLDDDNVFPDRIKALEEELNNLKRMYQQSTANKAKRVKVEASSSKSVFQPGEVIDLT